MILICIWRSLLRRLLTVSFLRLPLSVPENSVSLLPPVSTVTPVPLNPLFSIPYFLYMLIYIGSNGGNGGGFLRGCRLFGLVETPVTNPH